MADFTAVFEIWLGDKIQMLVLEMKGELPQQTDMETRESVLNSVQTAYPDYEVLDLVGIVQNYKIIWKEEHGTV